MLYLPRFLKQCSQCGEYKLATLKNFHPRRAHWCHDCVKKYQRQYGAAHRKEALERVKQWQAEHPEELRQATAKYYDKHREEQRQKNAKYRAENKEKERRRVSQWNAEHREEYRAHRRNRHARKRNALGKHTANDVLAQYKCQHGKCYYCGKKAERDDQPYHVDHVIPLSRGGSNGPENIVIACYKCNLSKNDKLPSEWIDGGKLL